MNEDLHLGAKGAKLIKSFEGLFLKAYYDPIHVLTIGWGHTNDNGEQFTIKTVWTQEHCDAVFLQDMKIFEAAVKRRVTVELNQNQFDALCSFTYNCGEGNLQKSRMLRLINQGNFDAAAGQFALYNRAGGNVLAGLTRRRAAEALLFQSTSISVSPKEPTSVGTVDEPSNPSLLKSKIVAGASAIGVADVASTTQQVSDTTDSLKHMGLWDHVIHALHNPSTWALGLVLVACGAIIYWRWKDHS